MKFEERRRDNSYDSETPVTLMGSKVQNTDYSYLRISINRCNETYLKKVFGNDASECFDSSAVDDYLASLNIVMAMGDGYVDIS